MFAYTKNNTIEFIAATELPSNFLPNLAEFVVLEYSDEIKNPVLEDGKIVEMKIDETDEEKRKRKFEEFAETDDFENFDWEGVEVTESDYNNLIILRDFNGDAGSQLALLTKAMIKMIGLQIAANPQNAETIKATFADELAVVEELSETRKALGLSEIVLPF